MPDGCTGDDIKIAWGYKKNKVRPRNKVDTGDNVMRSILIFKIELLGFDFQYFRNCASTASLKSTATTAFSLNGTDV